MYVNLKTGVASNIGGNVSNINMVIGGSANDTLIGGSAADILVGGGGNESLTAGSGRAILIGGSGTSTLTGGGGDDIFIGGSVSFYNQVADAINLAAFDAILTEWASNKNVYTRYNDLTSGVTGSDGNSYALNLSSVIDNFLGDALNRGTAGTDWFFLGVLDTDNHNPTDKVTNLP